MKSIMSTDSSAARKNRNAYMLFYAKRNVNENDWASPITGTNDLEQRPVHGGSSNDLFNYNPESLAFLWDLVHLQGVSHGDQRTLALSSLSLKFSLYFVGKLSKYDHAENEPYIRTWINFMKGLVRNSFEDSKWLLQNLGSKLLEPIFSNPEKRVRKLLKGFVIDIVKTLQNHMEKNSTVRREK